MAALDALVNTCATCGAEESLDALIHRMIDDEQVRRLIADIMTTSLPLGGLVLRYLRLHKPAKQKLRMDKVAKVLSELLGDMQRGTIERKGRGWAIDKEGWKLALEAVFAAELKGSLTLPLDGNAYLYEVVMRLSDKAEGEAEKVAATSSKSRAFQSGAQSIADLAEAAMAGQPVAAQPKATPLVIAAPRERVESPTVKAFKAEQAQKLALRTGKPSDLTDLSTSTKETS
jgi:hypothetical protein